MNTGGRQSSFRCQMLAFLPSISNALSHFPRFLLAPRFHADFHFPPFPVPNVSAHTQASRGKLASHLLPKFRSLETRHCAVQLVHDSIPRSVGSDLIWLRDRSSEQQIIVSGWVPSALTMWFYSKEGSQKNCMCCQGVN